MDALRLLALSITLVFAGTAAHAQSAATEQTSRKRGSPETPKAGQDEVPQPRQDKTFPVGASWTAVSLNNKPFSGDRPSFSLDKQFRAKGFAGCNTFSATAYPLREQGIAVGPIAFTKKACDKATMASERAFLTALRTTAKWDSNGSSLVLKGPNGELRFERVL